MRHNINISALRASAAPRALTGFPGVQANLTPAQTVEQITAAFASHRDGIDARFTEIESYMDQLNIDATMNRVNGGGQSLVPPDAEYSASFNAYFRGGVGEEGIRAAQATGGRAQIMAAMSSGSESDGGYLAPVEWDRTISQALRAKSPLRRLCTVRVTTVRAFTKLWKLTGPGSGWVGETAARPATSTPTFASLEFGHGELYANPAITQGLLDDSAVNVQELLGNEVVDEFEKQETVAFLSGNGANKPFGILGYVVGGAHESRHPGGSIAADVTGHATTIPNTDVLVDFVYKLPSPYRQNAVWLMNSTTAATIAKMKDGDGNYVWREGLVAGQPSTLLGYPVEIEEGLPAIGAGNLPILFGDFRAGYVINDRTGLRVLRDPYSNKPFVHFYSTKRVGGGVLDPNAIRALKIAAA